MIRTLTVVLLMLLTSVASAADAPASAPATTQAAATQAAATREAAPQAKVTPEAAALLATVSDAYGKLKSLDLAGTLSGDFDVDGNRENPRIDLAASFEAPNRFRHALADGPLLGSTGEKLFVYNEQRKLFSQADAPKGKSAGADLPAPFGELLAAQNLSLLLALSTDPAAELKTGVTEVTKVEDVKIDDRAHPALRMTGGGAVTTVLIDPQTNLLRRVSSDVSDSVKLRGAQDVKQALITIDYAKSAADAATKPEQFAWSPPAGSKDVAEMQPGDTEMPALALVGKPAPDFKLKDLADKEVSLSALKGSVVVLDFWATWCPPCVAAMPGLDKLHQDKQAAGLKVLAIDQDEDKELVQGFINSKGLKLPVLLDPGAKVGEQYRAEVLPTTLVIGKDGVVKMVVTKLGPEGEKQLHDAVEKELEAK